MGYRLSRHHLWNGYVESMIQKIANNSRLWLIVAAVLVSIGGVSGTVAMIGLDPVGEEVTNVTRGDYVRVRVSTSATGCTVLNSIMGKQFAWIGEYPKSYGVLNPGFVIENMDHCNELIAVFPNRVELDGEYETQFRLSDDGDVLVSSEVAFDRHWSLDLGLRALILLAGLLAGVVAALPWIAIFQVTRRLEEIRDRR
jgi:hypothetical protein